MTEWDALEELDEVLKSLKAEDYINIVVPSAEVALKTLWSAYLDRYFESSYLGDN